MRCKGIRINECVKNGENNMDIIILANFCGDFTEKDNSRFLYLANILSSGRNNTVEIVTSSFSHTGKKQRVEIDTKWPFKVTFLYEPGYLKNISIKRFYSHYVWGKNVARYLKKRKKPDVIYCAVPSLTAPYEAENYCRRTRTRFVVDIQDLWPEAFRMIFKVPIISAAVYYPFQWMVDRIYRAADAICAVSRTYADRALSVNRKCSNAAVVFLGTNLDTFDRNAEEHKMSDKSPDELWLAYCGTLGRSYDLICVIDALELVKKKGYEAPKFIVMGDGPQKKKFEAYAKAKGISAEFVGRMPYDRMCGLLKSCDFAVNPIVHGAAQSIINKHADYAAAGLAVLNTQENTEYRSLVNEYKMGINCRNNDPEDLAEKMILLMNNESKRKELGRNARKCAEKKFDRKSTYQVLVDLF